MKALILSCNTGGGHNAAGAALREMLEERGHEAIFLDYLTLAGKWTSALVGDLYIDVVKKAPKAFGCAYKPVSYTHLPGLQKSLIRTSNWTASSSLTLQSFRA